MKFCYTVAVILIKFTLFLNEGVIKSVLLQKQFEKKENLLKITFAQLRLSKMRFLKKIYNKNKTCAGARNV